MGTNRSVFLGVILVAALVAWLIVSELREPPQELDRGAHGIEFIIPDDYVVLELGEATTRSASERLLHGLQQHTRLAAVFVCEGERIQLLVDRDRDAIDERAKTRLGTVRRVLWTGSVDARLQWRRNRPTRVTLGSSFAVSKPMPTCSASTIMLRNL